MELEGKSPKLQNCKRLLCDFLSHEMLVLVHIHLREYQIFVIASGYFGENRGKCRFVHKGGMQLVLPFRCKMAIKLLISFSNFIIAEIHSTNQACLNSNTEQCKKTE